MGNNREQAITDIYEYCISPLERESRKYTNREDFANWCGPDARANSVQYAVAQRERVLDQAEQIVSLTAERDAAKEELKRLRELVKEMPWPPYKKFSLGFRGKKYMGCAACENNHRHRTNPPCPVGAFESLRARFKEEG